ncbi:MAG TPA: hypothetical protein VGC42_01665 [Kofleriaceae bacterium]
MITHDHTYASLVSLSERACWKLDEIFPDDTVLDLSRPFLPEKYMRTAGVPGLSAQELLRFNQISGHGYCHLFDVTEEFVVVNALGEATQRLHGDRSGTRAWMRLSDEEMKHQQLFRRFARTFARQLALAPGAFPGQADVTAAVLQTSPIAVILITLYLEASTLLHFTDAIRDDGGLEPSFVRMLKAHWQEESQHVKLDVLALADLVAKASPEELDQSIEQFFGVLGAFDNLVIATQAQLDVQTLERAIDRPLTDAQKTALLALRPLRYSFIELALQNPVLLGRLEEVKPGLAQRAVAFATREPPPVTA